MTSNSISSDRLNFIDIAKGLGIILVLFFHSCGIPRIGYFLSASYMQLFFIVSGYTYKQGRTISNNMKKRFSSIIIPYCLYNFFLLVMRICIEAFENKLNLLRYVKIILGSAYSRYCLYPLGVESNHLFLQNYNSPMWFLTALISSSIIYYLIVDYALRSKSKTMLSMLILTGLSIALSRLPILLPWSIDCAPMGALFMICGTMLKNNSFFEKRFDIKYLTVLISSISLYVILCLYNKNINMSVRNYGDHGVMSVFYFTLIGIIGSALYILFSKKIEKTKLGVILKLIGQNTISILCLHLFVFYLINRFANRFVKFAVNKGLYFWVFSILNIVFTLIICYIASIIISAIKKRLTTASTSYDETSVNM